MLPRWLDNDSGSPFTRSIRSLRASPDLSAWQTGRRVPRHLNVYCCDCAPAEKVLFQQLARVPRPVCLANRQARATAFKYLVL